MYQKKKNNCKSLKWAQKEYRSNIMRMRDELEMRENFWLYISCDSHSHAICQVGKSLRKMFSMCHNLNNQCRQNHTGKWRKNLNKCHFPYFRAQSGKDYFILSVSINVESERIGALFFLFLKWFFSTLICDDSIY